MRLPRMTTRRWMIVVAIVGLLTGATVGSVRIKRRRDHFLARTQFHQQEAELSSTEARGAHESVEQMEREIGQPEGSIEDQREFADYMDRWSAYHAAMARKYEHAARYPWLPVEPDPLEPE